MDTEQESPEAKIQANATMPIDEKETYTTIRVRVSTGARLKDFGSKGDSYDSILNKLIDTIKSYQAHVPSQEQ